MIRLPMLPALTLLIEKLIFTSWWKMAPKETVREQQRRLRRDRHKRANAVAVDAEMELQSLTRDERTRRLNQDRLRRSLEHRSRNDAAVSLEKMRVVDQENKMLTPDRLGLETKGKSGVQVRVPTEREIRFASGPAESIAKRADLKPEHFAGEKASHRKGFTTEDVRRIIGKVSGVTGDDQGS